MNLSINNQLKAFNKFKKLKIGALFMEMGSGKTKVAIDLINYNNVDLALFVVPFSSKNNLEKEINKWSLNCKYLIIGYETISSSDFRYLEALNLIQDKKVFIVADESTFIKNEKTKRFQRLIKIREKCEYALILTGTPITKNEWDLYNQMYFLSPKIIDMSRIEFLNAFFKHIVYKKKGEKQKDFYQFSEVNSKYLYKLIKPYIFKSNLDFNKNEQSNFIFVKYNDFKKYKTIKEEYLKEYLSFGNSTSIIKMLMKLNYIASNFKDKNDAVINYVENKQVIVFCNYLEEIEYISSRIECFYIKGKVTLKNRKEIIEKFKNNKIPLLITYGTGSFSLNLQFCNEIVYSSINFDYSKIEQSKYRIKRIGQNKDIKYAYFLTDLGITHLILENLQKKQNLSELIKEKIEKGDKKWLKDI